MSCEPASLNEFIDTAAADAHRGGFTTGTTYCVAMAGLLTEQQRSADRELAPASITTSVTI